MANRRSLFGLVIAAAGSLATGGCVTPAEPLALFEDAAPAATTDQPALNGEYEATFITAFAGPVRARLWAEPVDGGMAFKANTRPGVAWKNIGGVESVVGPLIAPFLFPSGMILHWRSTVPSSGNPGEGYIGIAAMSALRTPTLMKVGEPVQIRIKQFEKPVAIMTLKPLTGPWHHSDYAALVPALRQKIDQYWFEPTCPTGGSMNPYFTDMQSVAENAQDDVEFLFGTVMAWRRQKEMALPLVYPSKGRPTPEQLNNSALGELRNVEWRFDAESGVATIIANVFKDPQSVDSTMREVLAKDPRSLVIDLRNCPGFDISALRLASWLIDTPVDAGIFFGRHAREAVAADRAAEIAQTLPLDSPESYDAADDALQDTGAIRVVVHPVQRPFRGRVAVLITRRTNSTAEVLAAALRQWRSDSAARGETDTAGRFMFFGERTSKRPMIVEEVELTDGWAATLPVYDWRPSASAAADGRVAPWPGILPDVEASSAEAVKKGETFAALASVPE